MQPDIRPLPVIRRIVAKEVSIFFASPTAYLFLASFAAVTLFVFFWGEAFFARNIADVRPLFEWMPILLIFLASTLTMRLWSEERRTGTLEYVHAQPVPLWYFVLGKFVACLALLAVALAMTLPLPLTVSYIGDLDWGPVWAGYLATFLLGAAYLSIGLFVSARSDNQIVSLICATALCGVFYLLGTPAITDFFGARSGEWLRLLGTGSRFDAITRGVIDLRDLYYYLSLIATFLVLNALVLERERWAGQGHRRGHRVKYLVALLLVANALAGNLWLGQLKGLRADVTEGAQYSISEATENYLGQLREPLLIRGYFSEQTHPLLAPLVPRLEDLLKEYELAGDGRVRLELVDPATRPELEEEANSRYGIRPVPFQVADRYQSSIVSSYFNVLIHYGDEYDVLDFQDLVETRADDQGDVEVMLRNPEHDITQAIRRVLNSYQAAGNLFDTVSGELQFTAYVSSDERLPPGLQAFRRQVQDIVDGYAETSGGRLAVAFVDPDAGDGATGREITADFGFAPMTTDLLNDEPFFFYLTLTDGNVMVQVPMEDLSEDSFRRNLEAAIKRFASGFTRTVALVKPLADPMHAGQGLGGDTFMSLESYLGSDLNIVDENLNDGRVSGEADILLLLAPEITDERQLFAIDQFLMQGGTVIMASSPYRSRFLAGGPIVERHDSGLGEWLAHHGVTIGDQLVMDTQNALFPLPVTREAGGFQLEEVKMVDYPYFVDIRPDGMNPDNGITADLPQLTMTWASPIQLEAADPAQRSTIALVHSSPEAWLSDSTDVMPQVEADGRVQPFTPGDERTTRLLGALVEGRFDSFFAGKPSPLLPADDGAAAAPDLISSVIERSPESARIIVFSSNDFLKDSIIGMASVAGGSDYLNSLQLMANAVDWSLQDRALLGIRARGHFNRTLPPLDHEGQLFWEYLNYALAALALALVGLARQQRRRARQRAQLQYL